MKRRNFIFDIFSVGLISSITPRVKAKNFKIYNLQKTLKLIIWLGQFQHGKQLKQILKLV